MIAWAIPGTGWREWGSTTAAIGQTSGTYAVSNNAFTSSTEDTISGNATYGGGPVSRYVGTSTTETEEVQFVSTSLAATNTTQDTTSSFAGFGTQSTTTFTTNTTTQITASLPVPYLETTTRTNTIVTELTETENNNGPDFTVVQAVGNEVLWAHPLTTVSGTFEPYPAALSGYTTTRTTITPRNETITKYGTSTSEALTNPEVTNSSLSFSNTANSTITVTSASGSSMPMPTFTRTFRVQTTTSGGSYQFSVASNVINAGGLVAGSTTVLRTEAITTTTIKSYQFGTYQASYGSTTSFTQYSTGGWSVENSFTYETTTGPTSAASNTTITAFQGISGAVYKPVMLQKGFEANAGLLVMGPGLSFYGGSRAAFAGTQSGIYYSANSTVFFETALLNSETNFQTAAPQSTTVFPTSLTEIRGSGSNTTRYTASWSGPSFSATSRNSNTGNTSPSTYSGVASVVGDAISASFTKGAIVATEETNAIFRIGGHLPQGITGVAFAQENLVKIGIGTNTVTSIIGGDTTWSGDAPLTFIEPISSVLLNTSPSFEEYGNETVWAVRKFKQDPYPPYAPPEF